MSFDEKTLYARNDDDLDDFGDPAGYGDSAEEYEEEEEEEEFSEPAGSSGEEEEMPVGESAPPVMFIVPPEVSNASSPREDTEARLTPTNPRLRDSGLAGRVRYSARGRPSSSAEYRTFWPSGVKRAPHTLPRWKVI